MEKWHFIEIIFQFYKYSSLRFQSQNKNRFYYYNIIKYMKNIVLFTLFCVICYQQTILLSSLQLTNLRNAQLQRHNFYRAKHGCPLLTLNNTLNKIAQNYSQYLGNQVHSLVHSQPAKNGKYGQNLYWGWAYPTLNYIGQTASNSWYSQQSSYAYGKYPPASGTGHFTAMIWKSTKTVGFGFYKVKENGGEAIYVVANYYSTPNIQLAAQYASNVPKPI